jgi:hypothetical protein
MITTRPLPTYPNGHTSPKYDDKILYADTKSVSSYLGEEL